jgi:endonuclease/exonuclease/phosphatase (EEP) superfamily protein YafD
MKVLRGAFLIAANFFAGQLQRARTGGSAARRAGVLLLAAALGPLALFSLAGVGSASLPALEAFATLQVHFALAAAILSGVGLMLRWKPGAAAAAALLAANLGVVAYRSAPVDTCTVQAAATGQHVLRLMTLNIWGANRDFAALERVLAQHRPDVVVLQELRPHHHALLARLSATYPHQAFCDAHPDCGIAILSHLPLEPHRMTGGEDVTVLESAVTIDDQRLVVLGAHLHRPFAGRDQYDQFRALTHAVAKLPGNAVVAGDFNSVPWASNMAHYAAGAGVCASNLTHATWPVWMGPFGVPIDHIFLKDGVRLLSIATISGTGSDHKAVLATLALP